MKKEDEETKEKLGREGWEEKETKEKLSPAVLHEISKLFAV